LGLIGMRERAQALGGTFTISERDGGGTVLAVTLPLETSSRPTMLTVAKSGAPVNGVQNRPYSSRR
jgi:signal transduction histidine kinase